MNCINLKCIVRSYLSWIVPPRSPPHTNTSVVVRFSFCLRPFSSEYPKSTNPLNAPPVAPCNVAYDVVGSGVPCGALMIEPVARGENAPNCPTLNSVTGALIRPSFHIQETLDGSQGFRFCIQFSIQFWIKL